MTVENRQELMPKYVPFYSLPADDELNLVDIWIALRQYRGLFWKSFILLSVIALLLGVFVKSDKYEITTTIQIGTVTSGNTTLPIEAPQNLLTKINESILPALTKEFTETHDGLGVVKTAVSNPANTNLIVIKNKAKEVQWALYGGFQEALSAQAVANHEKIISTLKSELELELNIEQLALKQLEDPLSLKAKLTEQSLSLETEKINLKKLEDEEFFGIVKREHLNQLDVARNEVNSINAKKQIILARVEQLDSSSEGLKQDITQLRQEIENAQANRKLSKTDAKQTDTMSMLLIDNEAQENRSRLIEMQEKLSINTPKERAELLQELESTNTALVRAQQKSGESQRKYELLVLENQFEISKKKVEIDQIRDEIEKAKFDHQQEIVKQNQKISDVKARLENFDATRVISDPVISQEPVGLTRVWFIVIAIAASFFLALLLMIFSAFNDKVKARMAEQT